MFTNIQSKYKHHDLAKMILKEMDEENIEHKLINFQDFQKDKERTLPAILKLDEIAKFKCYVGNFLSQNALARVISIQYSHLEDSEFWKAF